MNLKYTDFHDYGLPYAKTTSAEDIMKNIEYLYQKMKQCTRNVTYFDLYKINTIITQDSEFESKINALEPYSTAIINATITTAKETYSPGDMIVKNIDGTTSTIFAQRGGIFYPKSLTKASDNNNNYTYDFSFAFQQASPSQAESEVTAVGTEGDAQYAQTITFKGLKTGTSASPYNIVGTKNNNSQEQKNNKTTITFPAATTNEGVEINPIVHAYIDNEEVYMDQNITLSANNEFKVELYGILCTKVVIK